MVLYQEMLLQRAVTFEVDGKNDPPSSNERGDEEVSSLTLDLIATPK
jgi:hypothetical protein